MPRPGEDLESRVAELETRLTHLARLCEQLNEVVTEQALANDRQQRLLRRMREQISELKEKPLPPHDPLDEKPPHY